MEQKDVTLEVAYFIAHNETLTDVFMKTQNSVHERLEKGERFEPNEMVKFPEFFELRVKANRKIIDLLKIYPTKSELDDALEMSAELMFENIVAFEDITSPNFHC